MLSACGSPSPTDSSGSDDNILLGNCGLTENYIVSIPGGTATIGSDEAYPEERPQRLVRIDAFEIDALEVTNAQFSVFVEETGYVTSAEKIQPGFDEAGAAVFIPPDTTHPNWWRFVPGASWRHPEGPESTIEGRDHDPVVQISHADAKAYAQWAGRSLPTAVQWEYAARAGTNTRYIWGDTRTVDGLEQANTWQGAFPILNSVEDGYKGRSPVGCFPPNKIGLYDMIGNVWEWTDTVHGRSETETIYVIKGGSFLCAENYCRRYRPASWQPQEAGFPTNHIGFRTVSRE